MRAATCLTFTASSGEWYGVRQIHSAYRYGTIWLHQLYIMPDQRHNNRLVLTMAAAYSHSNGSISPCHRTTRRTALSRPIIAVVAGCLFASPVYADDMHAMPYAGQQTRPIKALSNEDIDALRKGEGMGMAKAAELNGYPGPAHVLALGDQLQLADSQRRQVAAIFARLKAAAKPLGIELMAREHALDHLFAKEEITPESLTAATAVPPSLNC